MLINPSKKKQKIQYITIIVLYFIADIVALISCFKKNDIITGSIFAVAIIFIGILHIRSIKTKIIEHLIFDNSSVIIKYLNGDDIVLNSDYGSCLMINNNKFRSKYRIFLNKDKLTNADSYVFTDWLFEKNDKEIILINIKEIYRYSTIKLSLKDRLINTIKRLTTGSSGQS